MLRGSRPGERRGGRERDTPNRRTVLTDRILSVASENPTASRRALLLKLVKDEKLPADTRMAVAPKCFPAKRPQSGQSGRPRILASIRATVEQEDPATQNLSLQTVDALFGVVQDVTADIKGRRKAALKIAEFLLPKGRKKVKVLPDEHGFVVNPKLAVHYRDTVRELRFLGRQQSRKVPAIAEKIKKLEAGAGAILRCLQLPCPTRYGVDQAAKDHERLIELIHLSHEPGLTEEQDAEDAHLRVRLDAFRNAPEEIARKRCETLDSHEQRFKRSQLFREFAAPPLSRKAKSTLRLLRWLYPKPEADLSYLDNDDGERELHWYHPFRDELPAADGNFYAEDSKLRPAGETDVRVKGRQG